MIINTHFKDNILNINKPIVNKKTKTELNPFINSADKDNLNTKKEGSIFPELSNQTIYNSNRKNKIGLYGRSENEIDKNGK